MLTAAQIAQNRAAAIATVRAGLGLNDVPSSWTQEQRVAYNTTLANYIAARPESFSPAEVKSAGVVASNRPALLEDDSFDFGMFATETLRPASDALQSVGNGVLTVANAAKWAIPVGAVLLGGILLLSFAKSRGVKIKVPGVA